MRKTTMQDRAHACVWDLHTCETMIWWASWYIACIYQRGCRGVTGYLRLRLLDHISSLNPCDEWKWPSMQDRVHAYLRDLHTYEIIIWQASWYVAYIHKRGGWGVTGCLRLLDHTSNSGPRGRMKMTTMLNRAHACLWDLHICEIMIWQASWYVAYINQSSGWGVTGCLRLRWSHLEARPIWWTQMTNMQDRARACLWNLHACQIMIWQASWYIACQSLENGVTTCWPMWALVGRFGNQVDQFGQKLADLGQHVSRFRHQVGRFRHQSAH